MRLRVSCPDRRRATTAGVLLAIATLVLLGAGLAAGSDGWSARALVRLMSEAPADAALIVWQIRAPRTLGAWLIGALLGLAGAVSQGLFRNPLADPYLLGSASGASLGVVLVLAAAGLAGPTTSRAIVDLAQRTGVVFGAFAGAWLGVLATLLLARGARETTRLLLAGIVVGILLGAIGDLVVTFVPATLRGRQSFFLGNTGTLGWAACGLLGGGLGVTLPIAWRLARGLDALALGLETAASLGIRLARLQIALIGAVSLAVGLAVAEAGLIAFVGLVAPHLARRLGPARHGASIVASVATGGLLLLAADVLARSLVAPRELPVGVLTALLGGGYLLWRLRPDAAA